MALLIFRLERIPTGKLNVFHEKAREQEFSYNVGVPPQRSVAVHAESHCTPTSLRARIQRHVCFDPRSTSFPIKRKRNAVTNIASMSLHFGIPANVTALEVPHYFS